MNTERLERLRDTAWRRKLTPAEEAELLQLLAGDPAARADWEAEQALTGLVTQLPRPIVATNFTKQVMDAVLAEQARVEQEGGGVAGWWPRFGWRPRLAMLSGATALVAVVLVQHRLHVQQEVVLSVRTLSPAAVVPSVELLSDFDAIMKLGQVPPTDDDLLAALQ